MSARSLAFGLALGIAATPALADLEVGRQLYVANCANCHGDDAKGSGPFAEFLNIGPPSLTGIAAANDGEFPLLRVIHIIDGRSGVRGHGTEMPIWGERFGLSFTEAGPFGAEVQIRGLTLSLAEYLLSIQE